MKKSEVKFGQLFIEVNIENLISTILFLKTNNKCKFKQLIDITAVDYPGKQKRFKIIYLLLSHEKNLRIAINTNIEENIKDLQVIRQVPLSNGAILILNPHNGDVLAIIVM